MQCLRCVDLEFGFCSSDWFPSSRWFLPDRFDDGFSDRLFFSRSLISFSFCWEFWFPNPSPPFSQRLRFISKNSGPSGKSPHGKRILYFRPPRIPLIPQPFPPLSDSGTLLKLCVFFLNWCSDFPLSSLFPHQIRFSGTLSSPPNLSNASIFPLFSFSRLGKSFPFQIKF